MELFKENLDELLNSTKTITIKGRSIECENLNIVVTCPEYLNDKTVKQSINKLLTMLKNGYCDAINKMIDSESEIIHDQLSLLMSIVLYPNNVEVSLSYFSNKNPHMHVIFVSAKLMGDDSVSIELGDYQHIKVLFMKPLQNLINGYVLLVHTVLNSLFILSGKSVLNNSVFNRLNKKVLTELAQISYLSPNIYKEYYITLSTNNVSVKSYTFGLVDNVKIIKNKNNSVIVKPITLKSIIVRSDADWEIFSHINTITKQKINRFKIAKSRPLPLSADLMNQIIQVVLTKPDDSFKGRVFNKDNISIIVYTKQSVRSADMKKLQEKLTSVANKVFNLIKQAGFDENVQIYVELPDDSSYIGVKLFDSVTKVKINFAVVNKTMIYSVEFKNQKSLSYIRTMKIMLSAFKLMSKISKRPIIQVIPLYFLRFRGSAIGGVNNTFTVELRSKPNFGFFSVVPVRKIEPPLEEKAINNILMTSRTIDELLIKSNSIFKMYNLATVHNNLPDYLPNIMIQKQDNKEKPLNNDSSSNKTGEPKMGVKPLAKTPHTPGIPLPDEFDFEKPETAQSPTIIMTPNPQIKEKQSDMTPETKPTTSSEQLKSKQKKQPTTNKSLRVQDTVSFNQIPDLWLSNILNNLSKLKLSQHQYYYIQQSIQESYKIMEKSLSTKSGELLLTINLPTNIISIFFRTKKKTVPVWVLKYLVKESLLIIRSSLYLPFTPSLTYVTNVEIEFNNNVSEEVAFSITRRKKRLTGLPSYNTIVNNVRNDPIMSVMFSIGNGVTKISVILDNKKNSLNYSPQELNYLFSIFLKGVSSIMGTSVPQFMLNRNINVNNVVTGALKTLYDSIISTKLPKAVYHIDFINNFPEFIRTGDRSKGQIIVSVVSNNISTSTAEKYEHFIYSKLLSNLKI